MDIGEAFGLIGGIAGIIAVATVIYKVGFFSGSMRTDLPRISNVLEALQKTCNQFERGCAEKHTELKVKVDTIWAAVVTEALTRGKKYNMETENPHNIVGAILDNKIKKSQLRNLINSSDEDLTLFITQNCRDELASVAIERGYSFLEVLGVAVSNLRTRL